MRALKDYLDPGGDRWDPAQRRVRYVLVSILRSPVHTATPRPTGAWSTHYILRLGTFFLMSSPRELGIYMGWVPAMVMGMASHRNVFLMMTAAQPSHQVPFEN